MKNETAGKFFNDSLDRMAYLASRWMDEAQYEDINDYKKNLQKFSDDNGLGVTITKMVKRPFGCEFTAVGERFRYTIKTNGVAEVVKVGYFNGSEWLSC